MEDFITNNLELLVRNSNMYIYKSNNYFTETCSDGTRNQDETGIDCGGVCPACGEQLILFNAISLL